MSGAHQRERVAAGIWNHPSDGVKSWATIAKLIEEVYPDFAKDVGINPVLPWASGGRLHGNLCKALFMSLMHSSACGLAVLHYNDDADERGGDGKAFFKISRVVVPMYKRVVFDSLMFPSITSIKARTFDNEADRKANKTRWKTVQKQWETAGFDETVVNGDVVFTFSSATYYKQKAQQYSGRGVKRRREDSPDGVSHLISVANLIE